MSTEDSQTFAKHYARLKDINEQIRTMDETAIDKLLPLVEQGVESRKICEARIDAVKKRLEQLLGESNETGQQG
jgi:exodeoxyribonuclease VII small subunit